MKIFIILYISFLLISCNQKNINTDNAIIGDSFLFFSRPLEESLQVFATDVVVAQFVEKTSFQNYLYEIKFSVKEVVIGNAPEIIFVYIDKEHLLHHVRDENNNFLYSFVFEFNQNTNYLLALNEHSTFHVISQFEEYGYWLISGNPIINLINPNESVMFRTRIHEFSNELDFNDTYLTSDEIITTIYNITKNNQAIILDGSPRIRGSNLYEIIELSTDIILIEIVGNRWKDQSKNIDLNYIIITDVLKGYLEKDSTYLMRFFGNSVEIGEVYIVSVDKFVNSSLNHTSRHGIFELDRLDEIKAIIANQNSDRTE